MSMAQNITPKPQGMGPAIKRDSHQTSTKVQTQLKDIQKQLPLRVLSPEDFRHWQERGYVIVRNAVPAEHVERLKALLWEFEEKDPPIFHCTPAATRHIMKDQRHRIVETQPPYLWDNR